MATMKAVLIRKPGGLDALEYTDVPIPKPTAEEVLVKNQFVGINYIDTYVRSGLYPAPFLPLILGGEGAGLIESVGDSVTDFKKGDRVAYMSSQAYAEYTVAPTKFTIKVPDNVPSEVAGGSLIGGLTALTLVREAHTVKKGDWILVHAAAGGTGQLLGQVLRNIGAHSIGTVSTPEKGKLAKAVGYEHIIESYDHDTVLNKVKELTDGNGVICVYDGVGKATWKLSLDCLGRRGHMVTFGNASGPVPPFAPLELSPKSLSVTRANMRVYVQTKEEFEHYAGETIKLLSNGVLKIDVSRVYDLKDAGQAQEDLQARKTTGKLVLKTS